MPTYEYVCTECGSPLEVVQSIHEPSLTDCPACGGRLRKLFGNVGVVFKGSGFYRTDNRSKGAKSTAPSSGGGSSESKTEASKPAKPAKPAETASTSGSSTTTPASSSAAG